METSVFAVPYTSYLLKQQESWADRVILMEPRGIATRKITLRNDMSESKRTRHTASFLLSHFLNSRDSFEHTWLTGSLVSVLRYMFDIMEMTYNRTNVCICDKSIAQIAEYARTGRETVKRGLPLFVKHNLLSIERKKPRAPTHYGVGQLLLARLTVSLDYPQEDLTRLTTSLALGSPRAQSNPNKAHSEPTYKKELLKKDLKKERGGEKRASLLSDDFMPSEQSCQKAKESGLTETEANYEFDKFLVYYIEKGEEKNDWDMVLQHWFIRAGNYKKEKGAIKKKPDEVRSTVPWYNQGGERGAEPVSRLLTTLAEKAKAKLNGQGGHVNGLGDEGQGKTKGN
jgi:hypothetical protein